ncbi:hypothetical protein [Sphaerisporangium siamense]|uniref:Uncharacterized protein n=1 Tax=Sphaerisporangium siamense TaxID=795645 RepID=A0A7W7GAZ2_9ACTN|nr:hypothetical protein [Sphaerisporangium siamense]MBB4701919.1 hypothetical protein [Sphaerisporangium siamense]
MGIYFYRTGLDKADKLASVLGAFIGLTGLALALYGSLRNEDTSSSPMLDNESSGVHNTIGGNSTFHGPVAQGNNFNQIAFGSPALPTPQQSTPPLEKLTSSPCDPHAADAG